MSFLGKVTDPGDFFGARSAVSGAKLAAQTQAAASDAAIAEERRQFDTTTANAQPFIDAGKLALGNQGDLVGLGGADKQSAAIAALKASPLFKALSTAGTEGILQNASATGGLRGGNTQEALADNNENWLAQVIQQQVGNLGSIAGQGQASGSNLGAIGAGTANSISQLFQDKGSAISGGQIAAGNAQQNSSRNLLQLAGTVAAFI